MSKMPAKKKSCFQITSVTQAQVAAVGAADDTESLEDPDETRAEDVSSDIYDMSRPEYDPACDRSSSEEALNNVAGSSLLAPAGATQQQQSPPAGSAGAASGSVNASQPAALTGSAPSTSTSSTVSCTSRFRVIKLDHGIGEPFRRGRWTCTEFYEKDSEGSAAGRTADSTRHAGATVDPASDGGVGHAGGSAVAPAPQSGQGFGSGADASSLSSPRMHLMDTASQQLVHPQSSSGRAQGVSGLATPGAFSSGKPALGASAPHGVLSAGHNGLSQPAVHIQKSPVMPPSAGGSVMFGQPAAGLLQQPGTGGGVGSSSTSGGATPQQSGGPYAAAGQPPPHSLHSSSSSAQNVPAIAASSSVSTTVPTVVPSASSAVVPNVTAAALPAATLGSQGLSAAGFAHVESSEGARSEALVIAQSAGVPGKEPLKPLMPESLQLSTPTVNSLFGIQIPVDGDADRASGTNVAAIDNKIEQAMDLVKSHLMYAVREEVEVLKEQIKELYERNSVLERENAVLKSLANSEQLSQLSSQCVSNPSATPNACASVLWAFSSVNAIIEIVPTTPDECAS
uniref:TSC22 domain family, member 2 n=1 Tax=Tetraodon nigroviridis TaxID=99883 RepID=H3CQU6_TETNG